MFYHICLQEHIINEWYDETPAFHNILAVQYKDSAVELMDAYLTTLKPSELLVFTTRAALLARY